MAKTPTVLRALSILSLEDILSLSSVNEEVMAFEQVAGGEWAAPSKKRIRRETEAQVIPFPKIDGVRARDLKPLEEASAGAGEILNELSMDFILSQRNLWKKSVESMGLTAAIEEYLRQTHMVSIKVEDQDNNSKSTIRFITTEGLLIDKEQS